MNQCHLQEWTWPLHLKAKIKEIRKYSSFIANHKLEWHIWCVGSIWLFHKSLTRSHNIMKTILHWWWSRHNALNKYINNGLLSLTLTLPNNNYSIDSVDILVISCSTLKMMLAMIDVLHPCTIFILKTNFSIFMISCQSLLGAIRCYSDIFKYFWQNILSQKSIVCTMYLRVFYNLLLQNCWFM